MASTSSKPSSRKFSKVGNKGKPAELFRTDFISNMKVPDIEPLDAKELYRFVDPWRHEWNCGVQVPLNEEQKFKTASVRRLDSRPLSRHNNTKNSSNDEVSTSETEPQYDMDELDVRWLELFNEELNNLGLPPVSNRVFELAMQNLELAVHGKPAPVSTLPNPPSELDDLICDVCLSPNGEDDNDIVFCDNCNVGVHQLCYGVHRIPKGSWYCRPCSLGIRPRCVLCPNKGGAMKSSRSCDKWVHVSCALWIPEVIFENAETMEPATNLDKVPESRWALRCTLCTNRTGACIQCNYKACRTAFHVTCAQRHGLQLVSNPTFECYCIKHADPARSVESPSKLESIDLSSNASPKEWLANLRPYFLRNLLNVHQYTASSIFYYWRLKKLSLFGQPLIRLDDSDKLIRRQQEEALLRRIQLLMFLRQNMEKARNLCYMVEKREKLKRQMYKVAIERIRLFNDSFAESIADNNCNTGSVAKVVMNSPCKMNGFSGSVRKRCSSVSWGERHMEGSFKDNVKNRTKSVDNNNGTVNSIFKRNGSIFVGAPPNNSAKRMRRPIYQYSP